MIVSFKFEEQYFEYTTEKNIIKVYSVPKEYSEDGLYVADYSMDEVEPIPASEQSETKLLFYGIVRKRPFEFMDVIENHFDEVSCRA